MWTLAMEWFYLLLKPLLLDLVDHVVFTCFQVSMHKFLIYYISFLGKRISFDEDILYRYTYYLTFYVENKLAEKD